MGGCRFAEKAKPRWIKAAQDEFLRRVPLHIAREMKHRDDCVAYAGLPAKLPPVGSWFSLSDGCHCHAQG